MAFKIHFHIFTMLKKIKVMFTYEEYSKANTLGALMTGTIMGFIKYSDLSTKEKKVLATQLLWCYEHSGVEMSPSTKKEIEDILG